MTSPGVAFAKTTRPAIGSAFARERLFTRLDGVAGRTVAWISGPPGAGKTTLAASYVEARRYRSLWYQLDADDADVATFFHYLGHAARKLDPAAPAQLSDLAAMSGADVQTLARGFFRRLFASVRTPFALVLDNLHAVPAASALHAALEAGLGQVPKNCCVIVVSRNEPPASLARARVTGEMACVGWDELRLEPRELAEIAQLRGHTLAGEALEQYAERTQGWAAGLVLMLEHAKLSGRIAELPGDATPQVIFDYLAGEIFGHFEPRIREFMMRIACLPRMTAQVAEALTGEAKAGRLLLNLARNGYFVDEVPADTGRAFQLHPLLRDFLRGRAAQDLPEALGEAWLERAAGLLRDAGQAEDALSLFAESRNWKQLARLLADEAAGWIEQGRFAALEAWLDMLAPEVLERDPRLLLAAGVCRARSSPRAAQRAFEQAHEGFGAARDARGVAASARAAIEAAAFALDDAAALDRWIAALGAPQTDVDAAALAWALLLRDPGRDALAPHAARGGPLPRAAAALLKGDLPAARAQLDGLPEASARAKIGAELLRALHGVFEGSHAPAMAAARAGLALAEAEGLHAWDNWLTVAAAAAALGMRDLDAARSDLQRLEAGAEALNRGERAALHYLRAWLALVEGDGALARRESKTALALAVETGIPWLECLARVAAAQALADEGDRRARAAQLRAAHSLAERCASELLRFAVDLASADAAREAGDETGALAALRAAFARGREHGYQYAPGWRSRAVAELCALALRHDIEPEYARSLVRARGLAPRVPPLRVARWPWPFRVRALGRFELLRDGAPVEVSGKGPGRPMELLKVLAALGGQEVRADQIADALWPHVDADYAHKSFTATLHRLRRLLADDEALVLRDGRLTLNSALVWVDTWALEQVCAAVDELLRLPPAPTGGAARRDPLFDLIDEALALYRGPFLPDESEQPSYIARREELRMRLLRCLTRAARRSEEAGRHDAAADWYLRCIEADPLFEAPYRNLMLSYRRAGDAVEARATYERLRTILSARLQAAPSPETQAVFAELRASGS